MHQGGSKPLDNLEGKVAVVTGGASGIGRAMCECFAAQGMRVVVSDISRKNLDEFVSSLVAKGYEAIGVQTDVTQQASVNALAEAANRQYGNVHLLCNNAGVSLKERDQRIWSLAEADWDWLYAVHVKGVTNGIRAFVPGMIAHGEEGYVVNTSSGNGGLTSFPSSPIYASSKAAVTSITEVLHYHLCMEKSLIKAGVLFPGPHLVNTNLLNSVASRPAEFGGAQVAEDGRSMSSLAELMATMKVTEPSEVAEYTLRGIQENQFWILAPSEAQDERLRRRCQSILDRSVPEVPQL